MLGKIYIIKNSINDKVYVGQTIQMLHTRFLNHLTASQLEDTKFYRAIKKYGSENFYIELIEKVSYEALDEKEIYWISYFDSYKNGYNSTLGGQGVREIDYHGIFSLWESGLSVCEIAEKTSHGRDSISRILKEGFGVQEEEIKRRGYKGFYRVDDSQLLELWNSGSTPNQIVNTYGGDLATTKRRLHELGISEQKIKERQNQNQRNLSLTELKELWELKLSAAEIARRTGSNTQTIKKQLIELGYTQKDFSLRGKETCNQNRKAVVQLDKNGQYLNQYASAREAERATGVCATAIGACCNHKPRYKTAKGFIWIFLEEYENMKKG